MSRTRPLTQRSGDFLTLDLRTSDVSAGAPVYSWNLAPVGLLCGADNADGDSTYLAITLHAVLADLTRQGLDHLVRTLLA